MFGFLGARDAFFRMSSIFEGNSWSHRAASLFHQTRVKLFENGLFSGKKRPPRRDLRGV